MFKRIFNIFIFFLMILPIFSTLYTKLGYSDTGDERIQGQTRDPFVSLMTKKQGPVQISGLHGVASAADIEIQGLIHDEIRGSYVIANGVVLMEGEQEADVTVLEITSEGVNFLIKGQVEYKPYEKIEQNGG